MQRFTQRVMLSTMTSISPLILMSTSSKHEINVTFLYIQRQKSVINMNQVKIGHTKKTRKWLRVGALAHFRVVLPNYSPTIKFKNWNNL